MLTYHLDATRPLARPLLFPLARPLGGSSSTTDTADYLYDPWGDALVESCLRSFADQPAHLVLADVEQWSHRPDFNELMREKWGARPWYPELD